jgi:hypothetical protein
MCIRCIIFIFVGLWTSAGAAQEYAHFFSLQCNSEMKMLGIPLHMQADLEIDSDDYPLNHLKKKPSKQETINVTIARAPGDFLFCDISSRDTRFYTCLTTPNGVWTSESGTIHNSSVLVAGDKKIGVVPPPIDEIVIPAYFPYSRMLRFDQHRYLQNWKATETKLPPGTEIPVIHGTVRTFALELANGSDPLLTLHSFSEENQRLISRIIQEKSSGNVLSTEYWTFDSDSTMPTKYVSKLRIADGRFASLTIETTRLQSFSNASVYGERAESRRLPTIGFFIFILITTVLAGLFHTRRIKGISR